MSLKNLKKTVDIRPFKAIIYGTPKIGKSTFAANAPEALFINTDDGLDGIASTKYEVDDAREPDGKRKILKTIHEVFTALHTVLKEDHDFKTLAVDSLSTIERMIWAQVCAENSKGDISEIPYGKGYKLAAPYWAQFRKMLDDIRDKRNMIVILVGHHEVKPYRDPMSDVYDRYNLKLHEDQRAIFTEWADMILFADQEVHTVSEDLGFKRKANKAFGGNRFLYTVEDPKYIAGNRYGLPAKIALDWAIFWQTFLTSASAKTSQAASVEAHKQESEPTPEPEPETARTIVYLPDPINHPGSEPEST